MYIYLVIFASEEYDSELLFIETEEVYFSIKGNKETIGCGESKSLTIMVAGKFRGDIGYSDLYVMVNGNIHMKITIEVLPSKIDWLEKRPHLLKKIDGRYIPTEALQVIKKVTLDTKENRFLKFILIKIIEKIDSFIIL